ncbi:MAG TPA: arginine N-succinyltransferase [Candidatus Competibacteraceae bacterium]|nr:arginine N-succinyltransferase [Candidatus Competibacteraceae bacterium]
MLMLRPSRLSDIAAVERIAAASPVGMTSLPVNRETLYRKIQASLDSLAADVRFHGEESYFFVLEDGESGEVVGCSGIVASAGFNEPFYNYRNETIVHASAELGIHNRIHALSLCHDLTGNTLLVAFYIEPRAARGAGADLLSRGRFLFIANHPQRFAERIVAEMMGLTRADGSSPFWDSVGRRFFGIDYQEAELHCGVRGRTFIAELLPQHPLYVPLLSDEAQAAIGQVNPAHEVAFEVLMREGFETDHYIDIFDGGPTLHARTDSIRTIARSRLLKTRRGRQRAGVPHLIANTRLSEFRCLITDLAPPVRDEIELAPTLIERLLLEDGDLVRIAPL